MWDLFKAELLRLRWWAVLFALVHLLVLGFLTRVVDLAQQPVFVYRIIGGVYALAGVLLGLYQMGGYRRPNTWLNLLHRPLPHWRVAAALFGAGALLLLLAIALPVLVIAWWQETMTARVVDLRHWLHAPAAWLIALCSYLAGACVMLGRRGAVAALVLPLLLLMAQASGIAALALQVLVLAWLALMVASVFKPDLSEPPRGLLATIANALPLQMAIYLLFLLLCFGIEMLWIMQGTHPNNMAVSPPGGHNELERMEAAPRMIAGLADSTAPEAPLWREQIALSEVLPLWQQVAETPRRHALTNSEPMEFDDSERRMRWVFSHDRMRFEGYRLTDGGRVGELGVGADHAAFSSPPLPAGGLGALPEGDSLLVAGNTLYQYGSETTQVLARFALPQGEQIAGVQPLGESVAALTDRALYVFDGRDAQDIDVLLAPRLRVPLPGAIGDLRMSDVIELVDGYLVSFAFTYQAHDMRGGAPLQTILRVHDDGRIDSVAQHVVGYDYPALYRYQAWWPSPALHALREAAIGLFAQPDPLQARNPLPPPRSIWWLAVTLMVVSLLGAVWLTRRRGLSWPARWAWIAACGGIGLPALASLWLMLPAPVPDDAPVALPAPA